MLECDKAVAFGLSGGFVSDDDGFVDVTEGGEEGAEFVGGGFPTEAANEELAAGGVGVGD